MTLMRPELKAGDKAPDFTVVDTLSSRDAGRHGRQGPIFSVVPSLRSLGVRRADQAFNEEAARLPASDIYTVSMDLPFAQKRFCGTFGLETSRCCPTTGTVRSRKLRHPHQGTPDREPGDFRRGSGCVLRFAEYVKESTDHPNYDATLAAVKSLAATA